MRCIILSAADEDIDYVIEIFLLLYFFLFVVILAIAIFYGVFCVILMYI